MGNKELLVLILKLAQAQKKEQKAQALVGYLTREILRYMGKMEKCDPENMLKMRECYEKDLACGIKGFHQAEDYRNICERTLSEKEIQEFKANLNKYVLTTKNDSGRIYELANNSFRAMYDENRHVYVEMESNETVNA